MATIGGLLGVVSPRCVSVRPGPGEAFLPPPPLFFLTSVCHACSCTAGHINTALKSHGFLCRRDGHLPLLLTTAWCVKRGRGPHTFGAARYRYSCHRPRPIKKAQPADLRLRLLLRSFSKIFRPNPRAPFPHYLHSPVWAVFLGVNPKEAPTCRRLS